MKISSPKMVFANNYQYRKNQITNNNINYRYSSYISKNNVDDTFEFQKVTPSKSNISFGSYITPEQEKHCKRIVHGTSLVCAGISGAAGKATIVGADAWALRGTQLLMFAQHNQHFQMLFLIQIL